VAKGGGGPDAHLDDAGGAASHQDRLVKLEAGDRACCGSAGRTPCPIALARRDGTLCTASRRSHEPASPRSVRTTCPERTETIAHWQKRWPDASLASGTAPRPPPAHEMAVRTIPDADGAVAQAAAMEQKETRATKRFSRWRGRLGASAGRRVPAEGKVVELQRAHVASAAGEGGDGLARGHLPHAHRAVQRPRDLCGRTHPCFSECGGSVNSHVASNTPQRARVPWCPARPAGSSRRRCGP